MLDQASELRQRMQSLRPQPAGDAQTNRRILVCGSAPRIGTSMLAANLAVEWASRGRRSVLLDAVTDSQRSAAHLCRINRELATAQQSVHEPIAGAAGVRVLRIASANPNINATLDRAATALGGVDGQIFDYQILDAGDGLANFAQQTATWATDWIIVSRHEDASLMQAYAIVKQFSAARQVAESLHRSSEPKPATTWLAISEPPDADTVDDVFARFARGCQRFLGIAPRLLGAMPTDATIADAAACGSPFVLLSPRCPAAKALGAMIAELNTPHPTAAQQHRAASLEECDMVDAS